MRTKWSKCSSPQVRPPGSTRPLALAFAVTAATGLAGAALAAGAGGQDTEPPRPNVVVVVTDDQTLAQLDRRVMPETERLVARRGTTFTDAIVTTPLCCPSRAGFLTGQHSHNHGVVTNDYALLRGKGNTLPVWLRRAGYITAHLGKYLNGYQSAADRPTDVAPGWDVWHTTQDEHAYRYFDYDVSVNGRRIHYGERDRDYVTRVLNREAARLIRRQLPGERPLYLQVDHRAPHRETNVDSGGRCGRAAVPDPRDAELLAGEPLPGSPSLNEEDVSDKPTFVQAQPPLSDPGVSELERTWGCALASLRAVDRGVARIFGALERAGELGTTVLVLTSDNGVMHGEHRLIGKGEAYEEALRVPLLMRVPRRYRNGAPRVPQVDAPVANIDLAPTILELSGAVPCRAGGRCRVIDGRSLLPLLDGRGGWPSDRALAVEYGPRTKGSLSCQWSGVRAQGAVYVEHVLVQDPATGQCVPADERELYELENDPFQLESLYPPEPGTPEAQLAQQLQARLAQLRVCAGIAGRDLQTGTRPFCE